MSSPVVVVCRPEVAPGFHLAGLDVRAARDAEAATAAVSGLAREVESAVVLVQESLLAAVGERGLRRGEAGLVTVPFPDPAWEEEPSAAEEYLVEMLRRAVGYRVRLR